jgi:hypothetical protein
MFDDDEEGDGALDGDEEGSWMRAGGLRPVE